MKFPALSVGFYDLARADRAHHAMVNFKPAPVLQPKRCVCGKRVHAKLLVQQGMCDQCKLTAGVDENDLMKLRHALAAMPGVYPKTQWGSRNQYRASDEDLHVMLRLKAAGLVRAGVTLAGFYLFHATRSGCRAIGLQPAAISRALASGEHAQGPLCASLYGRCE